MKSDTLWQVWKGGLTEMRHSLNLYTIGTNFKKVNDNLQNNVTNVQEWYTNNKLAVNVPKTKVMLVTNKNAPKNDQKLSMTLKGILMNRRNQCIV